MPQLPLAVAVLRDPQMQTDRLYSTSARSGVMLCISAGYFLHVSCDLLRIQLAHGLPMDCQMTVIAVRTSACCSAAAAPLHGRY